MSKNSDSEIFFGKTETGSKANGFQQLNELEEWQMKNQTQTVQRDVLTNVRQIKIKHTCSMNYNQALTTYSQIPCR